MSKRESISRYNLIIKKLRRNPCSFNVISEYLELESEIQGYNFKIGIRTFQRDLEDILSLYNIEIKYDHYIKAYKIVQDDQPHVTERILEAFDTFNALNISDRLSRHIHFEKRKPQGTENLYGLLHAIRKQVQLKFMYQKFWEDEKSSRTIEPYILKEFKQRWYIIGRDINDQFVKSFGLDRLTDLEISKKPFHFPDNFDANEHFRYCFGIMSPNADEPHEIILSFKPLQGKYIKSMPLHETQEILANNESNESNEPNEQEFRIKLQLFITHDFIMELLSYGDTVKVIQPESLRDELKGNYERALGRYG